MADTNGIYFSPEQLQEFMAKAMAAAVAEARKMTPLEERKYNEEVTRERRRDRMAVELDKADEQMQRNKRLGCSHKCDPRTGLAVGRDRQDGVWTTAGQLHGNDMATLVCIRCAWTWRCTASSPRAATCLARPLRRTRAGSPTTPPRPRSWPGAPAPTLAA